MREKDQGLGYLVKKRKNPKMGWASGSATCLTNTKTQVRLIPGIKKTKKGNVGDRMLWLTLL